MWCLLQAESSNAELTLLVNKLRSEEAGLRDSLAKMGSLNEGLAQDKSDLNNIINQVCGGLRGNNTSLFGSISRQGLEMTNRTRLTILYDQLL